MTKSTIHESGDLLKVWGAFDAYRLGMQLAQGLAKRVPRVIGFSTRQVADSCLPTVASAGNLRLTQPVRAKVGNE